MTNSRIKKQTINEEKNAPTKPIVISKELTFGTDDNNNDVRIPTSNAIKKDNEREFNAIVSLARVQLTFGEVPHLLSFYRQ